MRSETASGSYRERLSDENALLLAILEGTARETGEEFFRVLVKELARALDTCGALVADYLPETGTLLPTTGSTPVRTRSPARPARASSAAANCSRSRTG